MNIDSLLDLNAGIVAFTDEGQRLAGRVCDLDGEDEFSFVPEAAVELDEGALLKLSDGLDAVMAKVLKRMPGAYRLCLECFNLKNDERRQDVRINDKLFLSIRRLGAASQRAGLLEDCRLRNQATRRIQESFLKGCYGYPASSGEAPVQEGALWEISRKLDLLINMNLSDDFRNLMQASPRAVNISAAGLRLVTEQEFAPGDILELALLLPQVPPLFIRTAAEVLRVKAVGGAGCPAWAIAVHFLEMSEENREDIIRYLFKRQREELRRRRSA
ncbi:MAG: PilZ domain protein [Deltaproteobacteria bacterium ADurb.Bin510]|nr:MAG: PilZ domain protein [Deltaproteobacteria bacterium ADurb.Bin510]